MKRIILGVTGGIAAYKSAALVSQLRQGGFEVEVIMTLAAARFVGPVTFEALSGRKVHLDAFEPGAGIDHIALARRGDLMLVAPATANTMARLAAGVADDLLTATALAFEGPVFLAPAMNVSMYRKPVTRRNIEVLKGLGFLFIGPEEGWQACGEAGPGRMSDPAQIVRVISDFLRRGGSLAGRRFVITAGPTREYLDPVRFLSNPSTGRMGFALAEAARLRGAEVTLISGPTELVPPHGVEFVRITSAKDMAREVLSRFDACHVVIKAAAVADWRPAEYQASKRKKGREDSIEVRLVRTPDILAELGRRKKEQVLVGFAAETDDLVSNARDKLLKKNLDLIVANQVGSPGRGFASDTNAATILDRRGSEVKVTLRSKRELAEVIVDRIAKLLEERK